jgi:hypothetical protein
MSSLVGQESPVELVPDPGGAKPVAAATAGRQKISFRITSSTKTPKTTISPRTTLSIYHPFTTTVNKTFPTTQQPVRPKSQQSSTGTDWDKEKQS